MFYKVKRINENTEKFYNNLEDENSMANDLLDLQMNINKDSSKLIIELLERNLMAWETSMDKRKGLLPEVYLDMKSVYEDLTGKEFKFREVKGKY